jgi:hypothetical protein
MLGEHRVPIGSFRRSDILIDGERSADEFCPYEYDAPNTAIKK